MKSLTMFDVGKYKNSDVNFSIEDCEGDIRKLIDFAQTRIEKFIIWRFDNGIYKYKLLGFVYNSSNEKEELVAQISF